MVAIFRPFFVLAGFLNGPEASAWRRRSLLQPSPCLHGEPFEAPLPAVERHGLEMMSARRHYFRLRP